MNKAIFIILILILISGCIGGVKEKDIEEDFHKGTQGVTMNFVRNAPPSKIYEGDYLAVSVELFNKGAYPDVGTFQGKLEISGFDIAAINGRWEGGNAMPADLNGKSVYNPIGGYGVMTYEASNVNVPFDADSYPADIIVHSCYSYKTIASPLVCIDPDPYEAVSEAKVCNVGNQMLSGGQGAPVAVTKIEQEVGADTIYFRIYIKNVGGGSVINPSAYDVCPFNLDFEHLNQVVVNADTSFDSGPRCTPAGTTSDPVHLINGEGLIFCSFRKPSVQSAYLTPLNIQLSYVYSSSISKHVDIINIR